MKGQSIFLLAPEAESELERYLERLRKGERLQPFEMTHRARSGRSVCAVVRGSAIFDSTHNIIGASFCVQDMTGSESHALKGIEGPNSYS
jgi:PAS domain S-box-containing protein